MTEATIPSGYHYHHTAAARGYISRRVKFDSRPAEPYNGRFGRGYIVRSPRWDTTNYHYVTYYIEEARA